MSFFDDASLAFLPSGAAGKDGKAYSIKPTDGTGDFTFSRGSNLAATRVGADGLIEKGRENLALYSNDFSQWTGVASFNLTTGQAGYDITTDASSIEVLATGVYKRIRKSFTHDGVTTFSVYAKANAQNFMYLYFDTTALADPRVWFDLSQADAANVIQTESFSISASVEDAGNGWYRCSITGLTDGNNDAWLGISNADNSYNTDAGDSIYIQDTQVEIGLAATDYIESGATTGKAGLLEDEPRFDYSGGATCPSLLLEPSRTQLIPQSEYISDTIVWSGTTAFTIEDNSTTSPEGVVNAAKLTPTTSTGSKAIYHQTSVTSGTDYTHSFFIKPNGYDYCSIDFSLAFGGFSGNYVIFDLTGSGSINSNTANLNASIEPLTNGWFRVSATDTAAATASTRIYLRTSPTASIANYAGNGTDGAYFYGFQLEEGSYPTSYIPNHSGGSVTRGADRADLTKAVVSEGSLFISVGGTTQTRLSVLGEFFDASTTINKVAIAYSSTILKISHNGSIVVDKTGTFDVSSLTEIDLGHDNGADQADAPIKQFLTFDELLTNAELNALTI